VVGEFDEPEWKLVRGRAKRRLIDPVALQEKLVNEIGIDDADIWVAPKMKSPAQLEKLGVGKEQRKLVKQAVSEYAFMPSGVLTIAPMYDPREAVSALDDAQNEFMTTDEDDEDDFT